MVCGNSPLPTREHGAFSASCTSFSLPAKARSRCTGLSASHEKHRRTAHKVALASTGKSARHWMGPTSSEQPITTQAACVELTRRLLTAVPTLPSGAARSRAVLKIVILFVAELAAHTGAQRTERTHRTIRNIFTE
jgi:hypothetical protein